MSPPDRQSASPSGSGPVAACTAWLEAHEGIRRVLFFLALAGLFWKPSSALANVVCILCGIANACRPGAFRPWRSPAGILLLAGCLLLAAASAFGIFPAGSLRDFVKLLPLLFFLSSLPGWLARGDNLFRAMQGTAAVLTARLTAELVRLFFVCGSIPALLKDARLVHPYLFTHPNVSSTTALLLILAWGVVALRAKRPSRRWLAAGGAALCLVFAYVMGSRGPQGAFAVVVLFLPVLLLPGWKARAFWGVPALAWLLSSIWAFTLLTHVRPADMPPAARCLQEAMDALNPRFGDVMTLRHMNGREVVWEHTDYLLETQGRTWRGYGFGKRAFEKAYYENPSQRVPRMRNPVVFPHLHSYYRQIRFEGGNGALACFVLAWAAALAGGLAAFVRRRRACAAGTWCARFSCGATEAAPIAMAAVVLIYGGFDYPDALLRTLQYMVFAALLALPFREKQFGR
jgi:O-antigen ligase